MKTYLKDLTPEEVIRRLKAGEVVKHDMISDKYKIIDGMLCGFFDGENISYNDCVCISSDSGYYFETPDELKLEVGKCYKTRDGRKAFVSDYNSATKLFRGVVVEFLDLVIWTNDGMYFHTATESPLDLISEWSDDDVAED